MMEQNQRLCSTDWCVTHQTLAKNYLRADNVTVLNQSDSNMKQTYRYICLDCLFVGVDDADECEECFSEHITDACSETFEAVITNVICRANDPFASDDDRRRAEIAWDFMWDHLNNENRFLNRYQF